MKSIHPGFDKIAARIADDPNAKPSDSKKKKKQLKHSSMKGKC